MVMRARGSQLTSAEIAPSGCSEANMRLVPSSVEEKVSIEPG